MVNLKKFERRGNDKDDSNNEQDLSGEDNHQENDSDEDKTQSDNENESDFEHEIDESKSGSKSDHEENEEDDDDEEEGKDKLVKTSSNDFDDKAEGDEDEEIDYTTSQLYDDVDIRLDEPVDTDKRVCSRGGGLLLLSLTKVYLERQLVLTSFVSPEHKSFRGNDKDDSNNEQDLSGEDNHQENDSDEDKTQSDNENESDFEHEIDESKSGSKSDHEENEEDDDDEEEGKDKLVKTSSNDFDDKAEGDEDEEIDYTTSQLYDDVDIRLDEPVDTDKRVYIPHTDAEIVSLLDVHVHHDVPSLQTLTLLTVPVTRVIVFEKEVAELKEDDPLKTQVTALVDEHLNARLGATRDEFMNFLSTSITTRITDMVTESLKQAVLAKESSQPQYLYEAAAMLTKFELKKILIDKMDKNESYLAALEHRECYEGLKKSYDLNKTFFSTYDSDMPHDQEENPNNDDEPKEKTSQQGQNQSWLLTLASSVEKPSKTFDELMSSLINFSGFIMNGLNINNITQETLLGPVFRLLKGTRSNYAELEYDFEECYKALSEKPNWENPKGGDYPFDLTKPLPLVKIGNHQKELKTWFQTFGVLLKSPMINMHFKESHIGGNNNWLTNLLSDDISDFTIALRMFTRILVAQKRVKDLQHRVESYQKKINVPKPETTKSGIRKRDPYTPYQDPQGFIYVNDIRRNRLMHSDELYKFSDGTLTRLRTALAERKMDDEESEKDYWWKGLQN
nr:hypothetical protein [Tanacetum cinerariifolium]